MKSTVSIAAPLSVAGQTSHRGATPCSANDASVMAHPGPLATEHPPPRVLTIDDNASVLESLRKILAGVEPSSEALDAVEAMVFPTQAREPRKHGAFAVDAACDGEAGCRLALQARNEGRPYAVAFVDMRMPGGWDGLTTIENLWRVDSDIQVVICTACSDHSWTDITARLGHSDRLLILRKPWETIEVLQLACALSAKWSLNRERKARLGELEQRVEERTRHLRDALSEREACEKQLQHQATHDALTGLPNRALLDDRMAQSIAQANRSGQRLAVLTLDLDRFKFIDNSFGHATGDALLQAVAAKLKATVREGDSVARLGGGEFVIMLSALGQTDDAGNVAQKLRAALAAPFEVERHPVRVTASIGVSVYPEDGENSNTLLKHANAAMHRAKEGGGDCIHFYTREMGDKAAQRMALENALHEAIEKQEFELHYQPQVDLRTGRIRGVEALIRWRRPELGLVAPDVFIPLAEETGLIGPIGEWVLRTACAQLKAWHAAGYPHLSMAVNLSARQFRQQDMAELVRAVLFETELAAEHLELELTESLLMKDSEGVAQTLRALKAIGVTLSLDDFGTGYSSLAYLKRFPIDAIKIDRSFICDVTRSTDDASLAKAILAMAQSLGMSTVAEGVETRGQLGFLKANRCDAIQGYYFSRPLPSDQMTALLRDGKRIPLDELGPRQAQRTLLLVDDEENMLKALNRLFRRDNYLVLSTTSPREALELLAANPVGVIVCDARMPEMPGVELLGRVKGLYPDIARVMLSGYTELASVTAAINEGAVYKFLTKPWDDSLLRKNIAEAFCRHELGRIDHADAGPHRLGELVLSTDQGSTAGSLPGSARSATHRSAKSARRA